MNKDIMTDMITNKRLYKAFCSSALLPLCSLKLYIISFVLLFFCPYVLLFLIVHCVIALALRLRRIEPEVSTERLHPSMRAVWCLTVQIPIARQNFFAHFRINKLGVLNFCTPFVLSLRRKTANPRNIHYICSKTYSFRHLS